ncbi:NAD(P)/FAD-dependent oxidoreductase [Longispora albida]|uniref:NAD(P)/FAD-dependent oxidoreductase n=1 Tax=Longispora albida TaxID=203523 RepID=UPI000362FBCB|nr:FAD-dependent oxidoreductase [Longispora albida]
MTKKTNVVVVGGGYAGVMAANRLTQNGDVTVTMVNPRTEFVARLRLHQLVGGSHSAVYSYQEVLAGSVQLVVDSVDRIDAAGRTVALASGGTLDYDYLVYAVGSGNFEQPVPGAGEFSYPVATLEAAKRLRAVLETTPASAAVTVIGAGPTGLETAAELAEQGRRVTLVCGGELAPYLHPKARRGAAKRFAQLGVTVIEGSAAKVTAVTRDAVRLADGRVLPSDVTIWAAGFAVPDLAARSGLTVDAVGRIITDESLTSVDDDRILAAGDSAAPSNLPFRMSAYVAYCLGAHAADTILHRLAGEQPTSADVAFLAVCVSLGREGGVYQLTRKDTSPLRLYLSGGAGKKMKELACNFSVKHLIHEASKPGSHKWLRDGTRKAKLAA